MAYRGTGLVYCGYCDHTWNEVTRECPKCGRPEFVHWNPEWKEEVE